MPKALPILSPFQSHYRRWKDCTNCDLCFRRKQTVFARGSIPCEILLVGEAPGFSEDIIGQPFVGPAGSHLDKILKRALAPEGTFTHTFCCTNLLMCIPKDKNGNKVEKPEHDNVLACQERLGEFIDICKPKLIVRLGKEARDYLDRGYRHALKVPACVSMIDVIHPAAILRANIANRELMTQKAVVQISNAADSINSLPGWGPDDRCQRYIPRGIRTTKFRTLEEALDALGKDYNGVDINTSDSQPPIPLDDNYLNDDIPF